MPNWITAIGTVLDRAFRKLTGQRDENSPDRRRSPRVFVNLPVLAVFKDTAADATIFEVSDGGLMIVSPRRVARGEPFTLRLHEQVDSNTSFEKIKPAEGAEAKSEEEALMAELGSFKVKTDAATVKVKPGQASLVAASTEFEVPKVANLNPDFVQQSDNEGPKEKIIKVRNEASLLVINMECIGVWCRARGEGGFNVGLKFAEKQTESMLRWKRDLMYLRAVVAKSSDRDKRVELTDKAMTIGDDPRKGMKAPSYTKVKKSVAELAGSLEVVDTKKVDKPKKPITGKESWMQINTDGYKSRDDKK